jgi:hypothetical protein
MHRITSYINNLHPHGNEALYRAIESVISAALPLWSLSLTALQNRSKLPINRIEVPQYFKFLDESGAEIDQNKRVTSSRGPWCFLTRVTMIVIVCRLSWVGLRG